MGASKKLFVFIRVDLQTDKYGFRKLLFNRFILHLRLDFFESGI